MYMGVCTCVCLCVCVSLREMLQPILGKLLYVRPIALTANLERNIDTCNTLRISFFFLKRAIAAHEAITADCTD